jgi:hypothetical protein
LHVKVDRSADEKGIGEEKKDQNRIDGCSRVVAKEGE